MNSSLNPSQLSDLVTVLKVPQESPLISCLLWTHSFALFSLCECRFSPGVANDPAPSTGATKRRTQSLSALPKDGDRKVSPVCRQSISRKANRCRKTDDTPAAYHQCLNTLSSSKPHIEGEGPHPPSHECIHDLQ